MSGRMRLAALLAAYAAWLGCAGLTARLWAHDSWREAILMWVVISSALAVVHLRAQRRRRREQLRANAEHRGGDVSGPGEPGAGRG